MVAEQKKIKVLTISDHPFSPSGVGTQTKYFISEMLKTGKYQFACLGGAIKHDKYNPIKVEGHGDDWTIYPVDGYGNQEIVRSMLRTHKPDILWFMTDPRFFSWLWEMENEIRALCPMVYYHVWDNYPYPNFNKVWYDSNDSIATISKLTSDIVRTVSPDVKETYLPHAIPADVFKSSDKIDRRAFRKENFNIDDDHFLLFWNNRNARRKQTGSLLFWYDNFVKELKKKHPEAKTTLLLHTDPKDPNGQDLHAIIRELDLEEDKKVLLSTQKMPAPLLAQIYDAADCTINISDAEGFGLSTLESLSCGTPIVVSMTGGLQEQVQDGDKEFGIPIWPASKAIIGSQNIPWIYEDRLSEESVVAAFEKIFSMTPEERKEMGAKGREHVLSNYGFEKYTQTIKLLKSPTFETPICFKSF